MEMPVPLARQMDEAPVIGAINLIPDTIVVELLCHMPFNFVWTDMEHGPQTVHNVGAAVSICLGRGMTPIVRVPEVADWATKWVLDQGMRGIVYPFVSNVEDARRAISAAKYPPAGHRGYFPDVAASRWGTDPTTYFNRANDEIAVILQIEDAAAVACIDEIAALDGWDVLFVGPMDLSSSYGKLGDVDDAEISAAIARVCSVAREAGGHAGILATKPEDMRRRIDEGFDFIIINPDICILRQAIADYWDEISKAIE